MTIWKKTGSLSWSIGIQVEIGFHKKIPLSFMDIEFFAGGFAKITASGTGAYKVTDDGCENKYTLSYVGQGAIVVEGGLRAELSGKIGAGKWWEISAQGSGYASISGGGAATISLTCDRKSGPCTLDGGVTPFASIQGGYSYKVEGFGVSAGGGGNIQGSLSGNTIPITAQTANPDD